MEKAVGRFLTLSFILLQETFNHAYSPEYTADILLPSACHQILSVIPLTIAKIPQTSLSQCFKILLNLSDPETLLFNIGERKLNVGTDHRFHQRFSVKLTDDSLHLLKQCTNESLDGRDIAIFDCEYKVDQTVSDDKKAVERIVEPLWEWSDIFPELNVPSRYLLLGASLCTLLGAFAVFNFLRRLYSAMKLPKVSHVIAAPLNNTSSTSPSTAIGKEAHEVSVEFPASSSVSRRRWAENTESNHFVPAHHCADRILWDFQGTTAKHLNNKCEGEKSPMGDYVLNANRSTNSVSFTSSSPTDSHSLTARKSKNNAATRH
ncbi:hypothetical protein AB6A40_008418 [Gnathostoma spinigerum]|uniref:Uncharacterized protein n=1 Tax=Gnathostoma spinigerum TaxID=75299 RepID=A0ABD6EWR9_9BILA